ncbi:MAG: hypothetical protein J7K21_05460 [Desulfurococcales archaeon]|nr:hypothetical protein [Desulfurococcales archaeon]
MDYKILFIIIIVVAVVSAYLLLKTSPSELTIRSIDITYTGKGFWIEANIKGYGLLEKITIRYWGYENFKSTEKELTISLNDIVNGDYTFKKFIEVKGFVDTRKPAKIVIVYRIGDQEKSIEYETLIKK